MIPQELSISSHCFSVNRSTNYLIQPVFLIELKIIYPCFTHKTGQLSIFSHKTGHIFPVGSINYLILPVFPRKTDHSYQSVSPINLSTVTHKLPTTVFPIVQPTVVQHQVQILDKSVFCSVSSVSQLFLNGGQIHGSLSTQSQGKFAPRIPEVITGFFILENYRSI